MIEPGQSVTAMLQIERHGYKGEMRFEIENLPHGVIVDNIGLNGIMVRAGENGRQVFLTAAKWVRPTERLIHAVADREGGQTSLPIALRVVGQVAMSEPPRTELAAAVPSLFRTRAGGRFSLHDGVGRKGLPGQRLRPKLRGRHGRTAWRRARVGRRRTAAGTAGRTIRGQHRTVKRSRKSRGLNRSTGSRFDVTCGGRRVRDGPPRAGHIFVMASAAFAGCPAARVNVWTQSPPEFRREFTFCEKLAD